MYGDHQDLNQGLELVIQDLLSRGISVPGVLGASPIARAFAEAWVRQHSGTYQPGTSQRIYQLTQVISPKAVQGRLRTATPADIELVARWMLAFDQEAIGEAGPLSTARQNAERLVNDQNVYLWENQNPVSMAAKVRHTQNGITIALVYTPPEQRGQGYASACVAKLSQKILNDGWQFCSLFTDLTNPTSNHIYQAIGYQPVCDFQAYIFHPPKA